jgi:hypothetical protein
MQLNAMFCTVFGVIFRAFEWVLRVWVSGLVGREGLGVGAVEKKKVDPST